MKKSIIGIDISKDILDYSSVDINTRKKNNSGNISNNRSNIEEWLKSFDLNSVEFSMEHTGHYGALLVSILNELGADYYMVNPLDLKKSLGIHRGKTDTLDAERIAFYTLANKHRLSKYKLPSEELCKIKALITARQRNVKISVQIKNSIRANKILNKTVNVKDIIDQEKKQLKNIEESIAFFESKMLELIKGSEELKKNYSKITKVIGVGPVTAIKCIVETDNFIKFTDARKFCCHSGLAPFKYQSGTSIRGKTKTHHYRNRHLKSVLLNAAGSAIQHDPQLKKYYNRKIDEGKCKLTVLNAVANKLVLRIFAVVKREEPFVKLVA